MSGSWELNSLSLRRVFVRRRKSSRASPNRNWNGRRVYFGASSSGIEIRAALAHTLALSIGNRRRVRVAKSRCIGRAHNGGRRNDANVALTFDFRILTVSFFLALSWKEKLRERDSRSARHQRADRLCRYQIPRSALSCAFALVHRGRFFFFKYLRALHRSIKFASKIALSFRPVVYTTRPEALHYHIISSSLRGDYRRASEIERIRGVPT